MTTDPRTLVDRLLRGVSGDHAETVRDAWRDLLRLEDAAVPAVMERLDTVAWADQWKGPGQKNASFLMTRYLGVLLTLLHELDPVAFRKEIDRLAGVKLNPVHRRTIEFLSKRCSDRPVSSIGSGVPVYVSDEIEDKSEVAGHLVIWGTTRDLDLENVTRIDVIAANSLLEYLGLYRPDYSGIVLTWREEKSKGIRLWWRNLEAEMTFYHEVGHHACGHVEGGQVEEQEREANRYMGKMFKNAHPVMFAILKTLYSPVKFFRKRILPKIRKRGELDF